MKKPASAPANTYAANAQIITAREGWFKGEPARIQYVGATKTALDVLRGEAWEQVAESDPGIKGAGKLKKLDGWSDTAPEGVKVESKLSLEEVWPEVAAPTAPVVVQEASEPEAGFAIPERHAEVDLSGIDNAGDLVEALKDRAAEVVPPKVAAPTYDHLTTVSAVAAVLREETTGQNRPEVIRALRVRAGEIAIGAQMGARRDPVKAKAPKVETTEESTPKDRAKKMSIAEMVAVGLVAAGDRLQARGKQVFTTLRADGTVENGIALNAWAKTVWGRDAINAYENVIHIPSGKLLTKLRPA